MIDLHTHTDQSDGSTPAAELVRIGCEMGLEALSITDHDTLAGYDLAAPVAEKAGLDLLCGIELSTRMEETKPAGDGSAPPRPPSVHVLGYFPGQPPSPGFRDWLGNLQASRRERNVKLVAKLQSLGLDIVLEEARQLGRNLTGRPHFAQVLLRKGYVRSIQEAFDLYLADDAKASVEREEPALTEGIRRIRDGGGIPVLAHPVRLRQGRDRDGLGELLGRLRQEGLGGIEVYHSEHSEGDRRMYLSLAVELGLIVTGGSDYHGSNKAAIELGRGKDGNVNVPVSILQGIRRSVAV